MSDLVGSYFPPGLFQSSGGFDLTQLIATLQQGNSLLGSIQQTLAKSASTQQTLTYPATAAGTNQGTAAAITSTINVFTTVGAGQGTILPTSLAGSSIGIPTVIYVLNRGANTLTVYPPVGQQIETLGANAGAGIFVGAWAAYLFVGGGQWYVLSP